MSNLGQHIHFAKNIENGELVRPDRATKHSSKGLYQCLDSRCERPVYLAISKNGKAHFRHYRGDIDSLCGFSGAKKSQELHTQAKHRVALLFENALLRKAPMPTMKFETPDGIHTVLPFLVNCKVIQEWSCGSRRVDVAIVDENNTPVLLIEINNKHAVDIDKREALKPNWWIEVDAKDVMEKPHSLIVRQHENFPYEYELLGNQSMLF